MSTNMATMMDRLLSIGQPTVGNYGPNLAMTSPRFWFEDAEALRALAAELDRKAVHVMAGLDTFTLAEQHTMRHLGRVFRYYGVTLDN